MITSGMSFHLIMFTTMCLQIFWPGVLANGNIYFIRQPSNQTVMAGTRKVVIQCNVANFKSSVNWEKDGFTWSLNRSPFQRYHFQTNLNDPGQQNLEIRNVALEDDGFFRCQVATQTKKLLSRKAYLNVTVPPTNVSLLPQSSDLISVKDKELVRITCEVEGSKPEAKICWRVAGVDTTSLNYTVYRKKGSKLFFSSSYINLQPSIADNGSAVECIVTHSSTNTELVEKAFLNVLYPPGPPEVTGLSGGPLKAGESITFMCSSIGGNPLATLEWSIDNEALNVEYVHHQNTSKSILHYKVKREDHRKTITCTASNTVSSKPQSTRTTLDVLYPPENVLVTQYPPNIFENGTVTLSCKTSNSNPTATLTWHLNGEYLSGDRSLSRTTFAQTSLTLHNVKREDREKSYVCRADIPALDYTREESFRISVYYPPTSISVEVYYLGLLMNQESGRNLILHEDQTIQIRCTALGGNPPPTLKWYRDDHPILPQDGVRLLDSSDAPSCSGSGTCSVLEITLTAAENGAEFECVADHVTSSISHRSGVALQVLFAPSALEIVQSQHVPVSGQPLGLTCITSSSLPAADITWLHGGTPFSPDMFETLHSTVGRYGGFVSRSRLMLHPIREDHGVKITCRAENSKLKKIVNQDLELNIEFPPFFEDGVVQFNFTKGEEELVIYVPATANPQNITYRWWRLQSIDQNLLSARNIVEEFRKVPLENSDRVSWSQLSGSLHIRSVRTSDEGIYVIEATNPRGTTGMNVTVNVLYSPVISPLQGPDVADVGDDVIIQCQVDFHPLTTLVVKWIKEIPNYNRFPFDVQTVGGTSTLTLPRVTELDRGVYRCVASNGVGDFVEKSFKLNVKFAAQIDIVKTPKKVALPDPSSLPSTATLRCFTIGYPAVNFHWLNENETVIRESSSLPNNSYVMDEAALDDDLYFATLQLKNVKDFSKKTEFTCVASNRVGSDAVKIKLVPRGPPDAPEELNVVNVTYNAIVLSWQPGFDGGVAQTFLLRYKVMIGQKSSNSQRWVQLNIPPNHVTYRIEGLIPSTTYWLTIRSINSYGQSDLSDKVVAKTSDPEVLVVGSTGSTFHYIPVVAIVCGVVLLLLLVILAVFLRRRISSNVSYQPKSLNTEVASLQSPASSVTGSERESSPEGTQLKKSFASRNSGTCGSSTNKRGDAVHDGFNRAQQRHLPNSPDDYCGRSDYSSVNHGRSEKLSGSSRNTSYSSLMHDDHVNNELHYKGRAISDHTVSRERSKGNGCCPQDGPLHTTGLSASSIDCRRFMEQDPSYFEFMQRASSLHQREQEWEEGCERCNEERIEYNSRLRRSETMRNEAARKPDNQRVYHTLTANASRNLGLLQPDLHYYQPVTNEAYSHAFQPRGARVCAMNTQRQPPQAGYVSGIASSSFVSSLQPPAEQTAHFSGQDGGHEHKLQRYSPTVSDAAAAYGVNVQPSYAPYHVENPHSNGLYVLGVGERNEQSRVSRSCISPNSSENESRHHVTFSKECDYRSSDNSGVLENVPPLSLRSGKQTVSYPRNSWLSSSSSDYSTYGKVTRNEERFNVENAPSQNHTQERLRPSSVSSSASSPHPLIRAPLGNLAPDHIYKTITGENVSPVSMAHQASIQNGSVPTLLYNSDSTGVNNETDVTSEKEYLPEQSEANIDSNTDISLSNGIPRILGVTEDGTLFI